MKKKGRTQKLANAHIHMCTLIAIHVDVFFFEKAPERVYLCVDEKHQRGFVTVKCIRGFSVKTKTAV